MRISTRNDYDKITALVFKGDTDHIGSACLLWSENKEHLYCITANHCTQDYKTGEIYDVHIKYYDTGELKEYKIIGDKISDFENDIAIYKLEQTDDVSVIPFTLTSNLLVPPKNSIISAYPKKHNRTRHTIRAEYSSINNSGKIELNLLDLDIDVVSRYDEIVGISGGGCYEVSRNNIKLFGIENKAFSKDVLFKEVYCTPLSIINQLLVNNKMTGLPKPTPSYITEGIGRCSSAKEALKKFNFSNHWMSISITESIINNVQNHFSNNETKTIFICGLSGIGKTRSVLMACTEKGFENTLYYENFSIFKDDLIILKQYTKETSEILNIIVDESQLKDWNYVNDELFDDFDFFRIVLIGTISEKKV